MVIEELYQIYKKHPVVCTDTRKITDGCIFFALKGTNFDGNFFAEEALKRGAMHCIIDDAKFKTGNQCIVVDDVLKTLQDMATYHRKELHIPVIAIVGSNGKTTTKELISSVLSTELSVWATPGNLNNHIGLPLTLLQLTNQHDIAVIEMGANHVGENEFLCNIAHPDYGIVTNNGLDHLEGFGNIEGVAKSNSELYYYLLKNKGTAFVNAHDEWLVRMSSRLDNVVTYAANTAQRSINAQYEGYATQLQPEINYIFETQEGTSFLSGDYNFDNIMAAIAIGKQFKLKTSNIIAGIAGYKPANNRSQWIQKKHNVVFMDAYNANPSSMEAALRNFSFMKNERKLVIIGDMFEMGDYAAPEHQRMVDLCKSLNFSDVLLVGEEFYRTSNSMFKKFETTQKAAEFLESHAPHNTAVFIKGSRGMKLETLMNYIP